MYSTLQGQGFSTGSIGGAGAAALVVTALPQAGVGPMATVTSMGAALVISALLCLAFVCVVAGIRLLAGTR